MKFRFLFRIITFLFCISFSVHAIEPPEVSKKAISFTIELSDGWWVSIEKDGSGAYGHGGSQLRHVRIKKGTFLYSNALESIEQIFRFESMSEPDPYMAIFFHEKGVGESRGYTFAVNHKLMKNLFKLAHKNVKFPIYEHEKLNDQNVKEIWLRGPPLVVDTSNINNK